jgi:alpha-1,3-rhamnosyl/mannosyltransferase
MRVVVNRWPAAGQRTGIGHYTAELLRCLARQAGEDEVVIYPPPWLQRARACLTRLASLGRVLPAGAARGSAARLPARAGGRLREWGRALTGWHFRATCVRRRADVYHEPNYIPLPCDVPTVATFHDLSLLLHPHWHPPDRVAYFERHLPETLRSCRHFLTDSEFGRRELIGTLNVAPQCVTCVHNGVRAGVGPMPPQAVQRVLGRLGLPERYLLHVGTIEPRKNVLTLLRAYCDLPAAVRGAWPLVLAGGWGWNVGPVRDYWHSQARDRGVICLGYVSERHLAALYNGARALLCPSLYEGFGLPPVEMMACGGAVIASTAGALVETVGARAHLLDPHDLDGWRGAMRRVTEDHQWWARLRQGVQEVARRFSWERAAAQTWAVYRMLAATAAPTAAPRAA